MTNLSLRLSLILVVLTNLVYAVNTALPSDEDIVNMLHESKLESKVTSQKLNPPKIENKIIASQIVNYSNLDSIDNMSNDILYKKRQLEQEKLNAEIKKARMGVQNQTQATIQTGSKETVQTVVSGVAIDNNGRKIAWLQFADGGSLTVNIGSQVGDYYVSNITMSHVTLTKKIGKKYKNFILKRSYLPIDKNNNSVINNAVFSPSPVITGANLADTNQNFEIVPPIVK